MAVTRREFKAHERTPFDGMISSDGHAVEPPDLWQERVSARLKDRAPRVEYIDGEEHLIVIGEKRKILGVNLDLPLNYPESLQPHTRAAALAGQGIRTEVLYPQWTMMLYGLQDEELQVAVLRAYNEWLAEFVNSEPGRFVGVGLLPVHDVGAALEGLSHAKSLGLGGVAIPSAAKGIPYNDKRMDPFWDAVEASGLPLSIHVGGELVHMGRGAIGANITRNLSPFRNLFPLFVFSGVLEKRPDLKLVLTEGGISWIAGTLYDMDMVYDRFKAYLRPSIEMRPSDIWRRQCFATFQDDPVGLQTLDWIGTENVLWAADYPHPEGTYPDTQVVLNRQFAAVPPEARRSIVCDNAVRLWSLAA